MDDDGAARPVGRSRRGRRWITRGARRRLAALFAVIGVLLGYAYFSMIRMPGASHAGPLPPLTAAQAELAAELRHAVEVLSDAGSERPGNRSTFNPRRFAQAAAWIDERLASYGYEERTEVFVSRGSPAPNIAVEVRGVSKPEEIVVVGAHYDSFQGSPGADDNASGTAACLALARRFAGVPRARTVRFVFFVNEEPPAFQGPDMGSWVYAKGCRARNENVVAMLSLEAIGYYSDEPGSQAYPAPIGLFYPSTGNFVGFVGNWSNRGLVRRCVRTFRETTAFPSEGAAPPGALPGVGWSDHWAFWEEGYPALMVTGTATYRNPHYHTPGDTADRLDYERMARVVEGVERVVDGLASGE